MITMQLALRLLVVGLLAYVVGAPLRGHMQSRLWMVSVMAIVAAVIVAALAL